MFLELALLNFVNKSVPPSVNLIVTNSISEVPELEELIKSCKDIVSYFHKSSKATDKLQSIQTRMNIPNHKLIQQVDTRWNSVFYMIERMVEQDEAVRTTLCLLNRNDIIITSESIDVLKSVIEVLRPFEAVTREMSADKYVSISKIIPLSRSLQRLTTIHIAIPGSLCDKLSSRMRRTFLNMEDHNILFSGTILDPRLKKIAFTDSSSAEKAATQVVNEALLQRRNSVVSDSAPVVDHSESNESSDRDDSSLWAFFDQRVAESSSRRTDGIDVATEMNQYLKVKILDRNEDPVIWWKEHEAAYPNLHKLAMKYLCIPGTSVPAERLFSKAGELVSARRNRLKPKHVNMMLFLNKYL